MVIKLLSVRQPWAWCIISAGKDIENRTWKTDYRGELYIHASKKFDYGAQSELMLNGKTPNNLRCFELGVIIGKVNLVDCVKNHSSSWAQKNMWHWVLENPVPVIHKPCPGKLGIFELKVDWI